MTEHEALALPMGERRALYEELGMRVVPKSENGVFVHWALGQRGIVETTKAGRRYIKKELWRVAAKRLKEERAAWPLVSTLKEAERARAAALYEATRAAAVERIKKVDVVKDKFFEVSKSLFCVHFNCLL